MTPSDDEVQAHNPETASRPLPLSHSLAISMSPRLSPQPHSSHPLAPTLATYNQHPPRAQPPRDVDARASFAGNRPLLICCLITPRLAIPPLQPCRCSTYVTATTTVRRYIPYG